MNGLARAGTRETDDERYLEQREIERGQEDVSQTIPCEETRFDAERLAVLSGPSFARETALDMPTAVTIAATNPDFADEMAGYFRSPRLRVYLSRDLVGVQIGGAIKNVLAIAAGISDGLGFGANTRAALLTRGLAELTRLGIAMGAKEQTLMGLSGLGDLLLTCTDDQSRNRRFGLALGRDASIEEAHEQIGQVVEGVQTVRQAYSLAQRYQVDMPIAQAVYNVVHGNQAPAAAVQDLLARAQRSEAGTDA